jgi:hypothetical protein
MITAFLLLTLITTCIYKQVHTCNKQFPGVGQCREINRSIASNEQE